MVREVVRDLSYGNSKLSWATCDSPMERHSAMCDVVEDRDVILMCVCENYSMVKRPRCFPYVCDTRDLFPHPKNKTHTHENPLDTPSRLVEDDFAVSAESTNPLSSVGERTSCGSAHSNLGR